MEGIACFHVPKFRTPLLVLMPACAPFIRCVLIELSTEAPDDFLFGQGRAFDPSHVNQVPSPLCLRWNRARTPDGRSLVIPQRLPREVPGLCWTLGAALDLSLTL